MKVIDDDDEFFPPRNIELTNIFRTPKWWLWRRWCHWCDESHHVLWRLPVGRGFASVPQDLRLGSLHAYCQMLRVISSNHAWQEWFWPKNFRSKIFSAENNFGRKIRRPYRWRQKQWGGARAPLGLTNFIRRRMLIFLVLGLRPSQVSKFSPVWES